jgi:hypothetical protein
MWSHKFSCTYIYFVFYKNKYHTISHILRPVECLGELGSLRSFNFVHVKRGANLAAHGLGREATTHVVARYYMAGRNSRCNLRYCL